MEEYINQIKDLDNKSLVMEYEYLVEFGESEDDKKKRLEVLSLLFDKEIFQFDN